MKARVNALIYDAYDEYTITIVNVVFHDSDVHFQGQTILVEHLNKKCTRMLQKIEQRQLTCNFLFIGSGNVCHICDRLRDIDMWNCTRP